MAKAAKEYLFASIPCVPAHNKWTKLAPCVDSIAMGLIAHGLMHKLFLTLKDPSEGLQKNVDMTDWDESLKKDVSFAATQGKRYKASRDFLSDAETLATLLRLALVVEPLRYLTGFWLRCASDLHDPCRAPRLQDMVWAPLSPVRHALQYLSSLLRGASSRLILLWKTRGSIT